jgi:hypothetical protein
MKKEWFFYPEVLYVVLWIPSLWIIFALIPLRSTCLVVLFWSMPFMGIQAQFQKYLATKQREDLGDTYVRIRWFWQIIMFIEIIAYCLFLPTFLTWGPNSTTEVL